MENKIRKYYSAANSSAGFFSLFGKTFAPENFSRLYIIRGGSGTGKSTLMKKIGAEAEKRGLRTDYVICSSDSSSLDGVIIPERSAAVFDGTAPHSAEPKYPGAAETAVDLYHALNREALRAKRDEIIALTGRAERENATAYKYLRALGEIGREALDIARISFDYAKADGAAVRLAEKLSGGGGVKTEFIGAFGKNGYERLDTYFSMAKISYAVTDKYGLGYEFLLRLLSATRAMGLAVTVFPSPINPEYPEALWFEADRCYFAVCKSEAEENEYMRRINIMRFVSTEKLAESRGKLRFSARCCEALLTGAQRCFSRSAEIHSELEKIYGAAMDFSEADKACSTIIAEIFDD